MISTFKYISANLVFSKSIFDIYQARKDLQNKSTKLNLDIVKQFKLTSLVRIDEITKSFLNQINNLSLIMTSLEVYKELLRLRCLWNFSGFTRAHML